MGLRHKLEAQTWDLVLQWKLFEVYFGELWSKLAAQQVCKSYERHYQ